MNATELPGERYSQNLVEHRAVVWSWGPTLYKEKTSVLSVVYSSSQRHIINEYTGTFVR